MSAAAGTVLAVPASCAIVPMQAQDIDAVLAVEQCIYPFPWTRGNFSDSLSSGYSAWSVFDGDSIVGYAVVMIALDDAHLLNISVVPGQQRAGLGSRLLQHLQQVARGQGARRMILEVRASNVAARAFYVRHGFVQIGARRDYYPAAHGREEAMVLEKAW